MNEVSKVFRSSQGYAVKCVSLELEKGEIMALLGESGSGKTTLLRMIAGFEKPTSGSVILYGRKVSGDGIFIEPEKRGVGIVFQDYALFPHLRVKENMEFGLKKFTPGAKCERIRQLMELTGTSSLGSRYPHELSGGQKQRIALARALAPGPDLILFDEPFSSIDSVLKNQMRKEIKGILKRSGATAVFVTHDTRDAMVMADRICMLRKGENIQTGTPDELYNFPHNAYVAGFFGRTNLIRAEITGEGLKTGLGILPYKGEKRREGEKVLLSIRPENFVMKNKEDGCICGNIVDRSFMGEYSELICHVVTGKGENEEVVIKIPPDESCEGKKCYFKPRKKGIRILSDKPGELQKGNHADNNNSPT